MKDLYETLDTLLCLLDRRSIAYVMIGGIAVRAHAIPRNTVDLDLLVSVDANQLPSFLDDLAKSGFEVPEAYRRGWVDRIKEMPLVKVRFYLAGHGIDADLFLVESAYQKSILQRRNEVKVEGRSYWIATAEDIVLLKLLAGRPRDKLDVADLFFISGQLDLIYLREWADNLNIRPEIEAAIDEAEQQN